MKLRNAAVDFDITQYVNAHGREPKGRGNWGFAYKVPGSLTATEVFYNQVTFGQAKRLLVNDLKDYKGTWVRATVLS